MGHPRQSRASRAQSLLLCSCPCLVSPQPMLRAPPRADRSRAAASSRQTGPVLSVPHIPLWHTESYLSPTRSISFPRLSSCPHRVLPHRDLLFQWPCSAWIGLLTPTIRGPGPFLCLSGPLGVQYPSTKVVKLEQTETQHCRAHVLAPGNTVHCWIKGERS